MELQKKKTLDAICNSKAFLELEVELTEEDAEGLFEEARKKRLAIDRALEAGIDPKDDPACGGFSYSDLNVTQEEIEQLSSRNLHPKSEDSDPEDD